MGRAPFSGEFGCTQLVGFRWFLRVHHGLFQMGSLWPGFRGSGEFQLALRG